jgi:hypothetical protein
VAAGFFDIDMFARGTSHDGRRGMPVVWSSAEQDIDFLVVQDAAKVFDRFGRLAGFLFDGRSTLGGPFGIDVTDVLDHDARELPGRRCQGKPSAKSHDADGHLIGRFLPL